MLNETCMTSNFCEMKIPDLYSKITNLCMKSSNKFVNTRMLNSDFRADVYIN